MSWVSDIVDDMIEVLRDDGSVRGFGVKDTSIGKHLTEDFPNDIADADFPVIFIVTSSVTEADEPGDDKPDRYDNMNLLLHMAIRADTEDERFDSIWELFERVRNALYRSEKTKYPNLNIDDILVESMEVLPDVLTNPYSIGVMEVTVRHWTDRDNLTGK